MSTRAIFRSTAASPGAPGHPERTGHAVEVVRELDPVADLVDVEEVGPMYRVRFTDGTEADAFADELARPRYLIRKQQPDDPDADRFPWYYTGADDNELRDYGTVETFAQAVAAVAADDRAWQECAAGRHPWLLVRTGRVRCSHCPEEWSADDDAPPARLAAVARATGAAPRVVDRWAQDPGEYGGLIAGATAVEDVERFTAWTADNLAAA